MAQSSDELIKREIIDATDNLSSELEIRIFPQSSNQDQQRFALGGLTFGRDGVLYGSCDAAWYVNEPWTDSYDGQSVDIMPVVALEGTDALSRGSSGNAQYQRFHHALGAVRNGVLGIYYFRPGEYSIQEDLFGMAYRASLIETGNYLVIDDLKVLKIILNSWGSSKFDRLISDTLIQMESAFQTAFQERYNGDWQVFAAKRSSIIGSDFVIKHAGRNFRNFTDSSQRAGHIAVGEMYLTKYLLNKERFYYLFPRLSREEIRRLDSNKNTDKEWHLLRNEPGVVIVSRDEIKGASSEFNFVMKELSDKPLKGKYVKIYRDAMNICFTNIIKGQWTLELGGFHGT